MSKETDRADKAYVEGKNAFYDGKSIRDSPYSSVLDYELHCYWCKGYIEAEVETYAIA